MASYCSAAGAQNLIIARVIETQEDIENVMTAIPNAEVTICQLIASNETLTSRVQKREIGTGREHHVARALKLANILAKNAPMDFQIETGGKKIAEIAKEIISRVNWWL